MHQSQQQLLQQQQQQPQPQPQQQQQQSSHIVRKPSSGDQLVQVDHMSPSVIVLSLSVIETWILS